MLKTVNPKKTNIVIDPNIKPKWVTFGSHEGPMYKGDCMFNPTKPYDGWTKIVGVIARCEGGYDTVIGYDGTGITAGIGQWTMKSGRLQKYLEFLKSLPCISTNETEQSSLFEAFCVDITGTQLFEQFGFTIQQGKMAVGLTLLDPNTAVDKIVGVCEGSESTTPKKAFLDLVRLFVAMGKIDQLQKAQEAYFKVELTHSLEYVRSALVGFGKGTINDLLSGLWETPAPALFFNLWQNSPGGAFGLFKTVWKTAVNKGIAKVSKAGYEPLDANAVFELAWKQTNLSSFGNWGWKSKQYLAGKGQPRVTRIKSAMAEFYGVDLPYYK